MNSPDQQEMLKIGTRKSLLALAQARAVGRLLGRPFELVTIDTLGDRTEGPLVESGGKGLFTAELEEALRRRQVHLAVHSAKDLPAVMAEDFVIAAVPVREDPRDALVTLTGADFAGLPGGARVGTSSLRRAAQVRAHRPDATVIPIRGNVDTRLRKLRQGQFDAIILALAGMERLGLRDELEKTARPLAVGEFVPAAGQGALAVECLAGDDRTRRVLAGIDDPDSAAAVRAERSVVRVLGADCRGVLAVHVWRQGAWHGLALAAGPAGTPLVRIAAVAQAPDELADDLSARLDEAGARGLPAD